MSLFPAGLTVPLGEPCLLQGITVHDSARTIKIILHVHACILLIKLLIRYVYFICDVPHLIKTIRNAWSHSSYTGTRLLTVSKDYQ